MLGSRSQGHGALTLCPAIASTTACELDIQKSQRGGETGPWCGSLTKRGLSSFLGIFYNLKDGLLRSHAGPPVGTEPRAQGWPRSLLSQEPTGPHTLCLPSRLWAPRLGAGCGDPGRLSLQA